MESDRKRGKFKAKFLAARQFINPTQAPLLSAASEGLQGRKKYNTSKNFTLPKSLADLGILGALGIFEHL